MEAPDILQHNTEPDKIFLCPLSTSQTNMDKLGPSLHSWDHLHSFLGSGGVAVRLVHGILADQYRQDVAYP